MPYIKDVDRIKVRSTLAPNNAGELNYLITEILLEYLYRNGPPKYQDYNDAIGVLSASSMELYRRSAAPYEDLKIKENGDVYPKTAM